MFPKTMIWNPAPFAAIDWKHFRKKANVFLPRCHKKQMRAVPVDAKDKCDAISIKQPRRSGSGKRIRSRVEKPTATRKLQGQT